MEEKKTMTPEASAEEKKIPTPEASAAEKKTATPDASEVMRDSSNQIVDASYEKYISEHNDSAIKTDMRTLAGVVLGSVLAAFNLAVFVNRANLMPGGCTGISLMIQRCLSHFAGISIPFAPLSLLFNFIPAIFAFKIIGKKYTIFSFASILIYSLIADLIPDIFVTDNLLLIAVFGGLLSGIASALILNSGASQGGTDFVAMCFAVKKGINTFNYVMGFNILLLLVSGAIFGMETALYTIIYQYVGTQTLNAFYKRFERKTLFIVTKKPHEVAAEIRKTTNHSCTILNGEGGFSGQEMRIVYTIIGSEELSLVKRHIVKIDDSAFINVVTSNNVEGKFYMRPYH